MKGNCATTVRYKRITPRVGVSTLAMLGLMVSTAASGTELQANPDTDELQYGKTLTVVDVLQNDQFDGSDVQVTIVSPPSSGKAWVAHLYDNGIGYMPEAGFVGTESIIYEITDAQGQTSEAEVSIAVKGYSKPIASADGAIVKDGGSVYIDVLANDHGLGDGMGSISIEEPPTFGTVIVGVDSLVYEAPTGFSGNARMSYKVTDADGDFSVANVAVKVECESCEGGRMHVELDNASEEPYEGYRVAVGPTPETANAVVSQAVVGDASYVDLTPSVSYAALRELGVSSGDTVCFRMSALENSEWSDWSSALCTEVAVN